MRKFYLPAVSVFVLTALLALTLYAETPEKIDYETLGKKLQNPLANLIIVPFENNFESGLGPEKDGFRYRLRFQPLIPVSLNEDWLLILRPIVPVVFQNNVVGKTGQAGLEDIELEPFVSPKELWPAGLFWGVGPIFLFPSASKALMGSEKSGLGPNGVVLKQSGPWTAGILAHHMWSYAGNDKREDIDSTYLQPFAAHTSKTGFSITASSETTYDWKDEEWTFPVIAGANQVFSIDGNFINIGLQGIYYPVAPSGEAKWGIRLTIKLLYPSVHKKAGNQ